MEQTNNLEAKLSNCCHGPAWQKTTSRSVLCWSGMIDTEHNGQQPIQEKNW